MNRGILYAIVAYLCWGVFPVYWRMLVAVESFQVIAHRIVWSFVFLLGVLAILRLQRRNTSPLLTAQNLKIYLPAGMLIGINWFLYVWAVNAGYILETSLGYFINPLFNVVFGVLLFRESLRPIQWFGIGLAAIGVLYLGFSMDRFPWIAIVLALSFAIYGVVKKRAPLDPVRGLTLETSLLLLPAVAFLMYRGAEGKGAFLTQGYPVDLLLVGAGVVTTIPLLFFAASTRLIPLSTVGVLQYLSPSLQFFCGVFIFSEPFSRHQLIGFSLVWLGLIVFVLAGFRWFARSQTKLT